VRYHTDSDAYPNTHSNTYPDSHTNAYSNTYSHTNANADTYPHSDSARQLPSVGTGNNVCDRRESHEPWRLLSVHGRRMVLIDLDCL
jgi:hypothetical protein